MRARMLRSITSLASGLALAALSACGGGAGGTTTPTIPGTLQAIALEGSSAPGTGAGTYGAFGSGTLVDVADGGWTAFVAPVIGGLTSEGLFVRRPDGVVVGVYQNGESVPAPGTGAISGFVKIWISPGIGTGAIVTAYITIVGGSVEGIVSARIPSNSVATEKAGVIYLGAALPLSRQLANPGNLASLDPDFVQVDDQGDVFLIGFGSNSVNGVYTSTRFGTFLIAIAATADLAPIVGSLGQNFDGLGIDANGDVIAYVVDISSGSSPAIIAQDDASNAGVIVSANGNTPPSPGGRSFVNVYAGGPIHVTTGGGTAFVVWEGELSGSAPDIGVFTRQVLGNNILGLGSQLTMAYPLEPISGVGVGAFLTNVRLLDAAKGPNRIPILSDIGGGTSTRAMFSAPNATTLSGVTAQGFTIPDPSDTTFTANFPSLGIDGIKHCDRLGSIAFSSVLTNGSSGVYWAVFGEAMFQVARQGGTVPGAVGGTFSSFAAATPVMTATQCVVFTASIAGGSIPSGLFIQG